MFATGTHEYERTAFIAAGDVSMPSTLTTPVHPSGIVLFAHDVGSGQFCPRDKSIAARMRRDGLATLLVDLLTPREAGNPAIAFDVALQARRLQAAARWVTAQPGIAGLPLGVFGAGTGAAAAMVAAAEAPDLFGALAARAARTDLAEYCLPSIVTPILLFAGGRDQESLGLNQRAMGMLTCHHHLIEVPGAGRRFEQVGALEHVAGCATEWFVHYLAMEPAWHAWSGPRLRGPVAVC